MGYKKAIKLWTQLLIATALLTDLFIVKVNSSPQRACITPDDETLHRQWALTSGASSLERRYFTKVSQRHLHTRVAWRSNDCPIDGLSQSQAFQERLRRAQSWELIKMEVDLSHPEARAIYPSTFDIAHCCDMPYAPFNKRCLMNPERRAHVRPLYEQKVILRNTGLCSRVNPGYLVFEPIIVEVPTSCGCGYSAPTQAASGSALRTSGSADRTSGTVPEQTE